MGIENDHFVGRAELGRTRWAAIGAAAGTLLIGAYGIYLDTKGIDVSAHVTGRFLEVGSGAGLVGSGKAVIDYISVRTSFLRQHDDAARHVFNETMQAELSVVPHTETPIEAGQQG